MSAITKTSGGSVWNGFIASAAEIPAAHDGFVQFVPRNSPDAKVGLAVSALSTRAFYCVTAGFLLQGNDIRMAYDNGAGGCSQSAVIGTIGAGDTLRVAIERGVSAILLSTGARVAERGHC